MSEVTTPEVKVNGVGDVVKAAQEPIRQDPTPTPSDKPEFNTDAVADPRLDTDNEGGRTAAKATGDMSAIELKSDLTSSLADKNDYSNKFELYGFKAQYSVTANQAVASDVRAFFDTEDAAKAAVSGNKYMHTFRDGSTLQCLIVIGAPRIAYADRERVIYTDGAWRESK